MNHKRTRIWALVLALALVLTTMTVTAFAADGETCTDASCTHVAAIGDLHYATLQDAVNSVTTNTPTVISLLKDAAGNGVVVQSGRNITFDLNNKTYTIDGNTVGSPNTATNGFQLLKNSTITFKNGSISSTKAKILIQNYSNLTLDNVTLNGSQLVGTAPYTLSNNFGNVVIRDSKIIAKTGGYAFDLYYWPQNGYADGVSVTVESNSVISGNVEFGGDGSASTAEKALLNITGGTFDGELCIGNLGNAPKADIVISGGTFTSDVSEYVVPGMKLDENGNIVVDLETAQAMVGNKVYTSLQEAVNEANGKTVYLLQNIVLDGKGKKNNEGLLKITNDLVLDGNGHKLTAENITVAEGGKGPSMVNVQNPADVTIRNLTIDGGKAAKHGLNIYQAAVAVENCKIENNRWYAVVVNGSSLTVDGLTTAGNGWGINVDNKSGNTSLTVQKATVAEESSLVIESSAAESSSNALTAAINGGQFQHVSVATTKATVTVNGGSFTTSMAAYTNSALKYELNSDGTYTYYKTFEEALHNAKDDAEIKEIGSSAAMLAVTVKYGNGSSDVTVSVPAGTYFPLPSAPSKSGYTFLGWWSDVTKETYKANEEVRITKDTTFYARWMNNWGIIGGIVGSVPADPFFTDVPGSAWYYDAVKFVYDNGFMDGVGNGKFNPGGTLTRAMIAQVLYNLEGQTGSYPTVFTDVAKGAWYANAVNWAAASGIVEGKGNNKFDPDAAITRQELAAIFYRYSQLKGYDVSKADSLSGYQDAAKVASWAKDAMGWAVENYVINGVGNSMLNPTGTATRAQVAQILMNYCNNVL